jgi:hypothetical protein
MKMTTFYSKLSTELLVLRMQELVAQAAVGQLDERDVQILAAIKAVLYKRGVL